MINGVNIDKIIGRDTTIVNNCQVREYHKDKNVLVTGGAGSIGSELVRQICEFSPKKLVVFDQGETPLNDLRLELENAFPHLNIECVLGDVSDIRGMESLFSKNTFNIVYHAAAYKHVPVMEQNPREGIRVNILGTKNIAELSYQNHVERFVMISTDKAVNPKSVMGMTKRVAELFIQYLYRKENNQTKFITTRFGNVLASNGSVIHRFRQQIENDKPLTVTHQEAERYFMTISESCNLVILAAEKGKGGEICVFDMGEPIKITDLVERLLNLYNIKKDDLEIIFTGLREGDKIREELFTDTEVIDFVEDKIMFSRSHGLDYNQVGQLVENMGIVFYQTKEMDWKAYLREILDKVSKKL